MTSRQTPEVKQDAAHKGSLRLRLLLTIAVALTPILIFAGFRTYLNSQDSIADRRNKLVEIADRALDEIEQVLSTVDTLQQIYIDELAEGRCEAVYNNISPRMPELSNVAYFNADGVAECVARGQVGGATTQSEAMEALRQGARVIRTDAFYGPLSQAWLFSSMRRVDDENGEFKGAISFALLTESLIRTLQLTNLPADVELAISDGEGQIFGSARFTALPVGWIEKATDDEDGELFFVDEEDLGSLDVVVRAIVDERMYAIISRPSPGFFSEFTLEPIETVGIPLLSFTLALMAAWLAVDGLVLKWLSRLRRLAMIYGEGHYNFRIGEEFSNAPDEIANFAKTFDGMANRIAERDSSLRSAIATRDAAVKEIHHRVKNNLQIVASFLNLQRRQLQDPAAREVISAARHRIDALSIVHQTLYQHERLETVHMQPFLDALLSHLAGALGMGESGVTIESDIVEIDRPADDAIPLALFILEAVTNAMKYAFDDEGGVITVRLFGEGDEIVLTVSDNGFGAEVDADADSNSTGLGARLMSAFAKQLRAKLEQNSNPGEGFEVKLRMPRESEAKREGVF